MPDLGKETEVSPIGDWIIKVTAKDTIVMTVPEGFQNLVGKKLTVDQMNFAIHGATYKQTLKKLKVAAGDCDCHGCFCCAIY